MTKKKVKKARRTKKKRSDENPTAWFKKAIIYQIYVDRFAGFDPSKRFVGTEFYGGNLCGITEKLDYLESLGITTVWISPFYACNAYHGYEVTDFFSVDPRFGHLNDFKELVDEVHKRGMKIIADFVPNHTSWKHSFFMEAQKSKESKYYNWFTFTEWPNKYECFLDFESLPKLNVDHPDVRKHLEDAAKYWLSMGLDGYRMDHAIGPTHAFWQEFHKVIKKEFPHCVVIGENWFDGGGMGNVENSLGVKRDEFGNIVSHSFDEVFSEYIGELDGCLDFEFQRRISECVVQEKYSPQVFEENLFKHYAFFPESFYLPNFLDTHDMDRFLTQAGDNKDKLRLAAKLQFETNQPKIINYGTEIGMGEDQAIEYKEGYKGDWYTRQPMRWDDSTWDHHLLAYYKDLIQHAKDRQEKE